MHFGVADDIANLASKLPTTPDAELVAFGVLQLVAEGAYFHRRGRA